MFINGHVPQIKLQTSFLEPWVKSAVQDSILRAMQCGFKIVYGNNPQFHTGKKFDGAKTDAVLLVELRLNKKMRHWTHGTIWAVREMPPHERIARIMRGEVDIGFLNFPMHYSYLSRLGCPPTPTDEVVFSKRLGKPKPKKANFDSGFGERWMDWDGWIDYELDGDGIFSFF